MLNLLSEMKYIGSAAVFAFIFTGLLLFASCKSAIFERESNAQVAQTPTIQNLNEQAVSKLDGSFDRKDCKEFIGVFPETFDEFNRVYGFDDEKGAGRLYLKYEEHISFFFECPEVTDSEKLKKVIKIGINGKWDADAVGMFQNRAFKIIEHNPNETEDLLDNLPDDLASSFWFFLFDGPHPNDKTNVANYESLQALLGKNSKQSKLLAHQFQKLQKSDGH
jgi:hypothetical protein